MRISRSVEGTSNLRISLRSGATQYSQVGADIWSGGGRGKWNFPSGLRSRCGPPGHVHLEVNKELGGLERELEVGRGST